MTFERGFPVSKYDLAYRATDAGIAAMRPGVRACDVWQAILMYWHLAGRRVAVSGVWGMALDCITLNGHPLWQPTKQYFRRV